MSNGLIVQIYPSHDTSNYGNIPQSIRALRAAPGSLNARPKAFCKLAPSEAGRESENAFRRMKQPRCCI